MVATLLAAGAISIAMGVAFGLVAREVGRRGAGGSHAIARRAHVTWWAALGSYLVLQGALTMLAGANALDERSYAASRVIAIPLLCASVWGISTYLVYLYTGRERAGRVLGWAYAAVGALFAYVTFAGGMPRILIHEWTIGLDDTAPGYRIVYLLVGLPPIVASIAYLALLRRTSDPVQRYRIKLVGGSILAYVASGLAARLAENDVLIFVTLVLLGGGAAVASVAAQFPPRAARLTAR